MGFPIGAGHVSSFRIEGPRGPTPDLIRPGDLGANGGTGPSHDDLLIERLRKMPRLRASIANAYAETFPRGRSLADFLHKPERKTAQVIMVWRIRGERKLPHDKAETVFALAMNDEEAFGRLLHLSGLDPHEIEDHGLTFRKLQSPVNLLEKLQELTGDEYGMATQEMTLPLLRSVVHQIMVDPETADDL